MRIVKWALLVIVLLLVAAGGAGATYFYVLHPKSRAPEPLEAPATAEAIARGRYLANHVAMCLGCHSDVDETAPGEPLREGRAGSGRAWPEIPEFPGHIRAPNLTPDETHGIGALTDGELVRAIREGVGHDGRALFPMMPYQVFARTLSDGDVLAIVAYLRSLPPLANDPGPMEVKFPVSMFIRTAPAPLEASPAPAPPASDAKAYGDWLLQIALCSECHTPQEKGAPIPGKAFAGGNPFPTPRGTIYTANITSDAATGIGAYSDDDLLRLLNEGVGKAGQRIYVMPWTWYRGMTDVDKRALIAAVRRIPPVQNVVPASTFKRD